MTDFTQKEVWFITGSQHLYGEETLKQVAANSKEIVQGFNDSKLVPVKLVHKDTVTTPDEITKVMLEANNRRECIGVVTWMHTFSPAKMWIKGLGLLKNRSAICIPSSMRRFRGTRSIWIS